MLDRMIKTNGRGSLRSPSPLQVAICLFVLLWQSAAYAADPAFRSIQEPSNLPYIASIAPPGGKLLFALKSSEAKNGRMTLILRYAVTDNASNVLRYYADLLPRMRWTLSSADGRSVAAAFKNYNLSASACGGSAIQITYQMPVDE